NSLGPSPVPLMDSMALMIKLRITCCNWIRSPRMSGTSFDSCVCSDTRMFCAWLRAKAMTSRIASLISSQSLRGGAFLASARIRPIISPARWPSLTMFAADFWASSRLGVCPASQRKHALALLTTDSVSTRIQQRRGVELAPRFCLPFSISLTLLTLPTFTTLVLICCRNCLQGVNTERDHHADLYSAPSSLSIPAVTRQPPRLPQLGETTSWEIRNMAGKRVLDLTQFPDTSTDLQLIGQTRNFYDGNAFTGLPLAQVG